MESVRWVLGESSAKEMRADAMDAVIFNGSANRKPISRASVELVFDNSLGGASGEWSQYAEISVKRVIERDKGSSYYINNTPVRRRDVADLFLGTGLGGRAYAIIGQNTISRIVEAKPEEMRVFLEEAAGITKYKERRRETELRLRDTRENLTRVEDILRELGHQILRLQSQAAVAQEYHQLQSNLNLTKGQIWLVKKHEASAHWEKSVRQVEKLVNTLEAQMAALRSCEASLETIRQAHAAATEALNVAQAQYYEANASVSTLENQVKNTTEARDRMQQQLLQLDAQLEKNANQQLNIEHETAETQSQLSAAKDHLNLAEQTVNAAQDALNQKAQDYQTALTAYDASQSAWLRAEQTLQLEQANINHLTRAVAETEAQLVRLQENLSLLKMPEKDLLTSKQSEFEALEHKIKQLELHIGETLKHESVLNDSIRSERAHVHQLQKEQHLLEAEIASLTKIQQSISGANHEGALSAWLKHNDLNHAPRFWQGIKIQPGWETALEAVLGIRLNAVVQQHQIKDSRPPAALAVVSINADQSAPTNTHSNNRLTTLLSLIEHTEPGYQAVLNDWLKGFYILETQAPLDENLGLEEGECLVNQQGDIYTKHGIVYFGAQSALHGVLERQARLDQLHKQRPIAEQAHHQAVTKLAENEASLLKMRANQQALQQQLKSLTQQAHQLNLEIQQLKQQETSVMQRKQLLEADMIATAEKIKALQQEKLLKETSIHDASNQMQSLKSDKSIHESKKNQTESALHSAREELKAQERQHQEKSFNIKLIENKINELNSKIEFLIEEKNNLHIRKSELETTLDATKMEALKGNLESALNLKQQRENALALARNDLESHQNILMQEERNRMQHEQLLHPLRDQLEAARLSEQEARLHFEQCQAELAAFNIDEATLTEKLNQAGTGHIKISQLEARKNQLESDITALGAVNLAAIEELESEQTRKQYLDSQCQDLLEASQTLEDAIRKIDRETRARLQATFDEANLHFNELFTTLFGGGQAKLVLLGDEILDTGMQVFAQPPGKKNSTIHLLSGGEKALTALALVFALFRLNPAPFCLMDEVDAPLDDSNTERFCAMVKKMSERTQFLYVSHNKITMEMAQQLIGVTMQESGVSRIVDVDMEAAVKMAEA